VGSAKISWGGGDVAPAPRSPVSRGNSNDGKCAQENCLTGGMHPITLCPILRHTTVPNSSKWSKAWAQQSIQ